MLTNTAKLVVASLALWALANSAPAQGIRPECAKMRDKVGCTCALENGGGIRQRPGATGDRWYSRSGRQAVNEGFVQCLRRRGRG
jgi:hypothetical protein